MDFITKNKQKNINKKEVSNLVKPENLDRLYKYDFDNRQIAGENNRELKYTVDSAIHDYMLIGYALQDSSTFNLDTKSKAKLFSVRNRNTSQILLSSKRYRKDSPQMARVKNAVKVVESEMNKKIFQKIRVDNPKAKRLRWAQSMDEYSNDYQDAIVACKDYLKDKCPITKKGIERYNLVRATMNNLLDEMNALSFAKQMVFRGKIGDIDSTLKDIIFDARNYYNDNNATYTDEEKKDYDSGKTGAYEYSTMEIKKDEIDRMCPELKLFYDAINLDGNPDILARNFGKNKEAKEFATNFLIKLRDTLSGFTKGVRECASFLMGDTVVNIFQREDGGIDINYCYRGKVYGNKYPVSRQKSLALDAKNIAHNIGLNMIENEKLFGEQNTANILGKNSFEVDKNTSEIDKNRKKDNARAYLRMKLAVDNKSLTNIPSDKLLEMAKELVGKLSTPDEIRKKIQEYEKIEQDDKKILAQKKEEAQRKIDELNQKAEKLGFEGIEALEQHHTDQEIKEEEEEENLEKELEKDGQVQNDQNSAINQNVQANHVEQPDQNADIRILQSEEQLKEEEQQSEEVQLKEEEQQSEEKQQNAEEQPNVEEQQNAEVLQNAPEKDEAKKARDDAYSRVKAGFEKECRAAADKRTQELLTNYENQTLQLTNKLRQANRKLEIFKKAKELSESDDEAFRKWINSSFDINFSDANTVMLSDKDIEDMKKKLLDCCDALDEKQIKREERIDKISLQISDEIIAINKKIESERTIYKREKNRIEIEYKSRHMDLLNDLEAFKKDLDDGKIEVLEKGSIDENIKTSFETWRENVAAKKARQDELVEEYRRVKGDLDELKNDDTLTLTDLKINGQDTLELLELRKKYVNNCTLAEKVIYIDEYEEEESKRKEEAAREELSKHEDLLEGYNKIIEEKKKQLEDKNLTLENREALEKELKKAEENRADSSIQIERYKQKIADYVKSRRERDRRIREEANRNRNGWSSEEEKLIGLVADILYAGNTWEMDTEDETVRLFNVFGKYSSYIGTWLSEPEKTKKMLSDFADKLPLDILGIDKEFITDDIFGWIEQNYNLAKLELEKRKKEALEREQKREEKRNAKRAEINIEKRLFEEKQAVEAQKDLEEEEADRLEEEEEKARKEAKKDLEEEKADRLDEKKEEKRLAVEAQKDLEEEKAVKLEEEKEEEAGKESLKDLSAEQIKETENKQSASTLDMFLQSIKSFFYEEKNETEEEKNKRLREERKEAREKRAAERENEYEEKVESWNREIEKAGRDAYSFIDNFLLTGKESDLIRSGVIQKFTDSKNSVNNVTITKLSNTQNEFLNKLHRRFRDSRAKIGRYINRNLGGKGAIENIEDVPYYRESNISVDERKIRIKKGREQLDKMIKNSMVGNAGEGQFLRNVLSDYIGKSSMLDLRCMLASAIRNAKPVKLPENATRQQKYKAIAPMLGGLFKGAGPLLQKILQGIPETMIPEGLEEAFEDTKSRLDPIPKEIVEAQLLAIVEKSGGVIKRIVVEKSLGAASVGQAFLCRIFTAKGSNEVVIKLLRPDVRNRMLREKKIMQSCASQVGKGMEKTYEGLLTRYLEELDLTIEARNTALGSIYNIDKNISAMKVSNLASPTPNSLVVTKAYGDTAVDVLKKSRQDRDLLVGMFYEKDQNGKLIMIGDNPKLKIDAGADVQQTRVLLSKKYLVLKKQQKMLCDLAQKWVTEAVFGKGYYHGDLHSGNIMLSEDTCTVIDFGNATVLDMFQQEKITQMLMAAAAGNGDGFYEGYTALLGEDSRRLLGTKKDELRGIFDKVMKLGDYQSTAQRIAAALVEAQKLGFELPPAIYGFQQCQIRLQDTIEAFNKEMEEIIKIINQLKTVEQKTILDIKGRYDKEASNQSDNVTFLKMVILPSEREDLRCLLHDKGVREKLDKVFATDFIQIDSLMGAYIKDDDQNGKDDCVWQFVDNWKVAVPYYKTLFSKFLDSDSWNKIFKDVGMNIPGTFILGDGDQIDEFSEKMWNSIEVLQKQKTGEDEEMLKKHFSDIFAEFYKIKDNPDDNEQSISKKFGDYFAKAYRDDNSGLYAGQRGKIRVKNIIEAFFEAQYNDVLRNLNDNQKKQLINALRDLVKPYYITGTLRNLWDAQDSEKPDIDKIKELEDQAIDCFNKLRESVTLNAEKKMKKKVADNPEYKRFYDVNELFRTITDKLTKEENIRIPSTGSTDYLGELTKEMKLVLEKATNKEQLEKAYNDYKDLVYKYRKNYSAHSLGGEQKDDLARVKNAADKLIKALRVPIFLSLGETVVYKKEVAVDDTPPDTFVDVMRAVINQNWLSALRRVNLLKAIKYGKSIQADINGQELSLQDSLSLIKKII